MRVDGITEQVVANALSKKYPSPQYAFLTHVRNSTGYGNEDGIRTADALALGLWASRGKLLEGFEIKVSRTDWLKELKEPDKAESIMKFCDCWWLVIGSEDIIRTGELPHGWGLKCLQKGHIVTLQQPEFNKEVKPMSRDFLCGFMRNMSEGIERVYTPTVEVEKRIKESVDARVAMEMNNRDRTFNEYQKLLERIKKFEEITGIAMSQNILSNWGNPEEFSKVVRGVMNGEHLRLKRDLGYVVQALESALKDVKDEIKDIPDFTFGGENDK